MQVPGSSPGAVTSKTHMQNIALACPSGKGPACKAGSSGFDSRRQLQRVRSSDLEERLSEKEEVAGSSPAGPTIRL